MKGIRVLTAVVALLVLPLVAVHAQGRGKSRPRPLNDECAAVAGQSGKVPPGQAKKCSPPDSVPTPPPDSVPTPPPDSSPPTGINMAQGVVFADLDADGSYSPFAGDTVVAGWTVQLVWNSRVINSATSDVNGQYQFNGLANGTNYSVCVIMQGGFTQGPAMPGTTYNGCGGTGYMFSTNSQFQTATVRNFSMLPL